MEWWLVSSEASEYRNLLKRYELWAPRYDRWWAKYSAATLSRALEAIPAEGESSLIDVACGTGLLAGMLRSERPELRITGVDISPQMLERARQRIAPEPGRMTWLQGTAEKLPVHSDQFDVLTCTNAFHLVRNAPAALAEFRRVLKCGGTLMLVDWCRDFLLMKLRHASLLVLDRQKRHIRTLDELTTLLEEAGLGIEQRRMFRTRFWGMMSIVARNPEFPAPIRTHDIPTRSVASVL